MTASTISTESLSVPTTPSRRRTPRDGLRVLVAQVTAEVRANLRVPEFLVGAVSVPILLYAMFGSAEAGSTLPDGTPVAAMMAVSFAAYGIVSLAIFTFGVDVAQDATRAGCGAGGSHHCGPGCTSRQRS